MRQTSSRKGFTLVELLVTIGLILVLMSILFPVMGAITRNARTTLCQANEKQIVAALISYSADNSGLLLAPSQAWSGTNGIADFKTGAFWAYLSPSINTRTAIMHCPADTLEQLCTYGGVDVQQPPYRNFSYSLNISMSSVPAAGPIGIRLATVRNQGAHVMVYEEFAPNDVYCYGPGDQDDWLTGRHGGPGTTEHRSAYIDAQWRADGRGNVGYFDGHVAIMSVNTYFYTTYHFGPLNQ